MITLITLPCVDAPDGLKGPGEPSAMTQTARVSIIILAQYPMWLNEALDSALAQDYPDCEIIIADCSGDKLVGQHLAARPDVTHPSCF